MADKQISDLTSASALTDGSLFVLEQAGAAMKANWGMMKNYISPGVAAQYSSSATYNVGDYVIYNDQLYRCTTAITTPESWTAAHWMAAVLGDDIGELKSDLRNWSRLDGVEIISGNLYPSAVEQGDGAYYYDGTEIQHQDYQNYKWFKIPVKPNTVYYALCQARFWYSLDENGNVVLYGQNQNLSGSPIGVGENAFWLVISYNFSVYPDFIITEGSTTPEDYKTFFRLPDNVFADSISGMAKAPGQSLSHNIFSEAVLYSAGGYADIQNGKLRIVSSASYNTYYIPVNGGIYEMAQIRTGVLTLADKTTAVGSVLTYATSVDSSGAAYLFFSINPASYPDDSFVIKKPVDNVYVPTNWIMSDTGWKSQIAKTSTPFNDGGGIEIPFRSAIKDGEVIIFKGLFSGFQSITLRFCTSSVQYYTNTITITADTITTLYASGQTDARQHGITIVNDISLTVEFVNGKAKITLCSSGHSFSVEYVWYQTSATTTYPAVISSGSTFTSADLIVTYPCALRNIWLFGDSYITFNQPERYPYYLVENGYADNALFSGAGGGNSLTAITAFQTLLRYGTPKIAVFATGMNDGNDVSATEPNAQWNTFKNEFLAICDRTGIIPIFCTIPTVPSVLNEGKNYWIRNSGCRYIDIAKAVGANANGTWYSGLLSGDNVHPSEYGAKAIYTQVLIDLPEITLPVN